jgi:hypothetical protein
MARSPTPVSGSAITNNLTITITGMLDLVGPVDVTTTVALTAAPIPPEPTQPPEPTLPPEPTQPPEPTLPPEPTQPPEPTPGPTPTALSVDIVYNGKTVRFDETKGTDRGIWTDARGAFVQRRVDVTNPDLPAFVVQFRPDVHGARTEVVFELGDTTTGARAANMTAYTASIRDADKVLATVSVPAHHWYSRWRWQSAPRPIVRKIEDLQAEGLLPYFDMELGLTRPLAPTRVYTPMGLAGLTAYGPTTGERDEIGLVTEAQAEYIRGDAGPESLFAQAEASGTLPWHYRDEQGGAVFNFKTHPNATVYYPANIPTCASPVQCDTAHEPPLAYVPFLLTGDPYYLEELQFAATFNVLCSVGSARGNFCIGFALRAHAWALRALAQCATMTPDDAPGWVQSRAYWKEWLDQERTWMLNRYVNPTAPPFNAVPHTGFHFMQNADGSPATTTIPASTYLSPWMEDYEGAVLCHVVMIGHDDWREILEWKLANTVDRTNGTSGWVRARTTIYTLVLRKTATSPYVVDWEGAWDLNVEMQPPEFSDIPDPDKIPAGASLTYASYTMSSLAMAATLGVEGAAECHEWLRGQLLANSTSSNRVDRKWTIASAQSV